MPGKDIVVEQDGSLKFPETPLSDLLGSKFSRIVDAVAYGGTHRQTELEHQGVLFFNPGSPTLLSDRRGDADLGGVAVLDLTGRKPRVNLVRLSRLRPGGDRVLFVAVIAVDSHPSSITSGSLVALKAFPSQGTSDCLKHH